MDRAATSARKVGIVYVGHSVRPGVWPKANDFAKSWALDRRFTPAIDEPTRMGKLKGWREALRRTLSAT